MGRREPDWHSGTYNHGFEIETPVVERPRPYSFEWLFPRSGDLIKELVREIVFEGIRSTVNVTDKKQHRRQLRDIKRIVVAIAVPSVQAPNGKFKQLHFGREAVFLPRELFFSQSEYFFIQSIIPALELANQVRLSPSTSSSSSTRTMMIFIVIPVLQW